MKRRASCHYCPKCAGRSKVTNSRAGKNSWRRGRECVRCKHRWTTHETTHDPDEIREELEAATEYLKKACRAWALVMEKMEPTWEL